jgi:hypothetical protein
MTKNAAKRCNRWLNEMFTSLNYGFFNGRLPKSTTVRFEKLKKADGKTHWCQGVAEIAIHSDLRGHSELATIVLLHEMVHADLYVKGYIGYDYLKGHSTLFHAGIDKLYQAGSYEDLL